MTSLKINNWPALLLRSINGIKWPVNHKFKVYHQKLCGYKCYLSLSMTRPLALMTSTNALLTATIIELTMQKGVVAMIFFFITVTHIYRKRYFDLKKYK